jgi:copper chaperone NosL
MKWPLLALTLLAGCYDETRGALPDPQILNEDATGYYSQMAVLAPQGPKAQLFLKGMPAPLWFSQVRDGLAYLKAPEQEAEILVLYVSDMGKAARYDEPAPDNWINAHDAFYVVGSDAIGGLGAPEIVPFGTGKSATEFAITHGGKVLKLDEIPAEIVLSPVESTLADPET